MNQILHILKKDARRHWPEILISIALLALFTRQGLHPWQNLQALSSFSLYWLIVAGRYAAPAMIAFWVFLIVRVVQGESLVGDRQWWVTKPYEWWNLLAAKLLFIIIFISVPLFHAHLFLLHHFGFPILPNLSALLQTNLALYLVLFVPALLLASLTRSFGQFALVVASILLAMIGIAWLSSTIPSEGMGRTPAIVEYFQGSLFWGSVIAVPVWQFARRRRWVTVVALLGVLALASLVGVAVPDTKTAEKDYSRVEAPASPAQIVIRKPADGISWRDRNPWFDATPEVYLRLPITVSGVAPGTVVLVDGMKITADSPGDSRWSRGWRNEGIELWPEDQAKWLSYAVGRKDYEQIKAKPWNVHIELALSEYQERDARILSIPAEGFGDETLGTCRLDLRQPSSIECLKPFQATGLMATFDPRKHPCSVDNPLGTVPGDAVSHAWIYANDYSFPAPNYTPIAEYSVSFAPGSFLTDLDSNPLLRRKNVILCPGSEIRLAHPELKRRVRIQLDIPGVRLQDLFD